MLTPSQIISKHDAYGCSGADFKEEMKEHIENAMCAREPADADVDMSMALVDADESSQFRLILF